MPSHRSYKKSQTATFIFSVIILIIAGWVFINRHYVLDEIALFQYQPSAEIISIVDSTKLTTEGRRYFYASRPEINDAERFNDNCLSQDEQSIVLGCYTLRRIYIFNVTDQRLNGVKEVTAAHEMLHAAYDRLSGQEKEKLNKLIENQVNQIKDARIINLIDLYSRTEPGQLFNEMHSILATEVSSLSPELEEYYKNYFEDRQIIVALSRSYETIFANNESRRGQLQKELEVLRLEIEDGTIAFNASIGQLNRDIELFNRRARDGSFASQSEFNSQRQQLINKQLVLQQQRAVIDSRINQFNQKREELIALNGEVKSLNQSLDSTPEAVPNF